MARRTRKCKFNGKNHVACQILLRSKDDSYYVVCGCGFEDLVAVWFESLPQWGLDPLETQMLHESFSRLLFAHKRAMTR